MGRSEIFLGAMVGQDLKGFATAPRRVGTESREGLGRNPKGSGSKSGGFGGNFPALSVIDRIAAGSRGTRGPSCGGQA